MRPCPCSTLFPYTTLFRSFCAGDPVNCSDPTGLTGESDLADDRRAIAAKRRAEADADAAARRATADRKSTRLNSSHQIISYAVFCLKKKTNSHSRRQRRNP